MAPSVPPIELRHSYRHKTEGQKHYTSTCVTALEDSSRIFTSCNTSYAHFLLVPTYFIITIPYFTCPHIWLTFRHHAPSILYIGQAYRYSPEYAFYIFSQQIYLIIFLDFLSPSSFIPPQNVVYFLMLPFLVYKIFTFYINGVLNRKCPAPGPKG